MTDDYEGLANELLQVNEALLQDPAPRLITQLTRGEHFVLNYLLTHHHQAHPVELSRHMVVSTARIAALLGRMEAIILSMTPYERENPNVLNSSRKRRIAAGSGTQVVDINRLLKQFEMMQAMTKQFAGGKMPKSMRRLMGKKGGKGMLGGKMPGLPF